MSLFQRLSIIFAVLLGLLLAIAAFFVFNASRRFNAKIRTLQAAGKPVTVSELGEPPWADGGGTAILRDLEKPLQSLEFVMVAAKETGDETKDREARNALFREFESEQPDLIELLREGAHEPGGTSTLAYNVPTDKFLQALYDQIGLYRSAARALHHDAKAELEGGSTDEAALDAIAILWWSEKMSHQPALVYHLSSVATRTAGVEIAGECLYRGDMSDSVRARLLDVLSQHDRVAAWSRMIDSERAVGLTLMKEMMPRIVQFTQSMSGASTEYLELMDQFEALGKQAWGIQSGSKNVGPWAGSVGPSMQAALEANRRIQSQSNAVLILAQWQDKGADDAVALVDLGLPKSIVTDPFDGSTMKFKMTTDGPIIYSVGLNWIDDGGALESYADAGIGPTAD